MRLIVSTGLPSDDAVPIGFGGDLLYVNTGLYWHAEPLMGEYVYLLSGFERVTVPLLASVHPRDWRRLLFLSSFTREDAPSPRMLFPPVPGVVPLSVASIGEYLVGRGKAGSVAVWADPLDRSIIYKAIVAGLESGLEELWLVYVYTSPPLLGDLEIGDTPAAYFYLRRHFPNMLNKVSVGRTVRLEENSLRFKGHMAGYAPTVRRRGLDLLGVAFGARARVAREILLDNLESGGSMLLKSVLEFLRDDKLYLDVFNRLLDYGYLKLAGIPPQIAITEKGLYALGQKR